MQILKYYNIYKVIIIYNIYSNIKIFIWSPYEDFNFSFPDADPQFMK